MDRARRIADCDGSRGRRKKGPVKLVEEAQGTPCVCNGEYGPALQEILRRNGIPLAEFITKASTENRQKGE